MVADTEEIILAVQLLAAKADRHAGKVRFHTPAGRVGEQRIFVGVLQKYSLVGEEGDASVNAVINGVNGIDFVREGYSRGVSGHDGGNAHSQLAADAAEAERGPLLGVFQDFVAAQCINGLICFLCQEGADRLSERNAVPLK